MFKTKTSDRNQHLNAKRNKFEIIMSLMCVCANKNVPLIPSGVIMWFLTGKISTRDYLVISRKYFFLCKIKSVDPIYNAFVKV